jgi:hypothetical protein
MATRRPLFVSVTGATVGELRILTDQDAVDIDAGGTSATNTGDALRNLGVYNKNEIHTISGDIVAGQPQQFGDFIDAADSTKDPQPGDLIVFRPPMRSNRYHAISPTGATGVTNMDFHKAGHKHVPFKWTDRTELYTRTTATPISDSQIYYRALTILQAGRGPWKMGGSPELPKDFAGGIAPYNTYTGLTSDIERLNFIFAPQQFVDITSGHSGSVPFPANHRGYREGFFVSKQTLVNGGCIHLRAVGDLFVTGQSGAEVRIVVDPQEESDWLDTQSTYNQTLGLGSNAVDLTIGDDGTFADQQVQRGYVELDLWIESLAERKQWVKATVKADKGDGTFWQKTKAQRTSADFKTNKIIRVGLDVKDKDDSVLGMIDNHADGTYISFEVARVEQHGEYE